MKYILSVVALACIILICIIIFTHFGALDYFQHKSYKIVGCETFVANPHPIDSVKIFGESDFDSVKIYSGEWVHTRRRK